MEATGTATTTAEWIETGEQRDVLGVTGEYRRSGLTQRAFARREGIKYTTFCSWAQAERAAGRLPRAAPVRSGDKAGKKPAPAVRFVEACLSMPVSGAELVVCLPDGTELRGGDAAELAKLVRSLRD